MIAKEFKRQNFAGDSESPASLIAVIALERVARFCIFAEWELFSMSFDASIAERQKNEQHYNLLRSQLKRMDISFVFFLDFLFFLCLVTIHTHSLSLYHTHTHTHTHTYRYTRDAESNV